MASTRRYIPPMKVSDGTLLTVEANNPGRYTLLASTTYVYIIGASTPTISGLQMTGYDAALVLTSATIQDTMHAEAEITNTNTVVGDWVNEDPTTAFVAVDGTGWAASNRVVTVAGSGLGGAVWQLPDFCAYRMRLIVVVGATGGRLRVSANAKG